jgi:hypothetical protein
MQGGADFKILPRVFDLTRMETTFAAGQDFERQIEKLRGEIKSEREQENSKLHAYKAQKVDKQSICLPCFLALGVFNEPQ